MSRQFKNYRLKCCWTRLVFETPSNNEVFKCRISFIVNSNSMPVLGIGVETTNSTLFWIWQNCQPWLCQVSLMLKNVISTCVVQHLIEISCIVDSQQGFRRAFMSISSHSGTHKFIKKWGSNKLVSHAISLFMIFGKSSGCITLIFW